MSAEGTPRVSVLDRSMASRQMPTLLSQIIPSWRGVCMEMERKYMRIQIYFCFQVHLLLSLYTLSYTYYFILDLI